MPNETNATSKMTKEEQLFLAKLTNHYYQGDHQIDSREQRILDTLTKQFEQKGAAISTVEEVAGIFRRIVEEDVMIHASTSEAFLKKAGELVGSGPNQDSALTAYITKVHAYNNAYQNEQTVTAMLHYDTLDLKDVAGDELPTSSPIRKLAVEAGLDTKKGR